jgi:hypothetical protein
MANQSLIDSYAATLGKLYPGSAVQSEYIKYMAEHPDDNPLTVFNGVNAAIAGDTAALAQLPSVLKDFVNGAAKGVSQEATGGGLGVAQASQALQPGAVLGDIWTKLNSRGTWIRVAEVTLGIALVLVALAHMTGADKVVNLPATIANQVRKATKT